LASDGRAAKMLNIYLKTAVYVGGLGHSGLAGSSASANRFRNALRTDRPRLAPSGPIWTLRPHLIPGQRCLVRAPGRHGGVSFGDGMSPS